LFSEPALVRRWQAASGSSPNSTRRDMLDAASAGDQTALAMLVEAGDAIGRYLAIYCNIVDPEVIVVGGEAVSFGDFLFNPMREALARGMLWKAPPITPDWVDNSWAQGAAALATHQIFDFQASSGT
jgi:predicted NBD/HSP70 family sugar kinase